MWYQGRESVSIQMTENKNKYPLLMKFMSIFFHILFDEISKNIFLSLFACFQINASLHFHE